MIIPYVDNNYFFGFPFLPPNCSKPPTVYSILNSIVNGNKEEEDYTKIKNLAKEGRGTIFDFDYPLTSYITREKFETMILNHFLMRRIGFETVTAFKIQLDVKLNEIMPMYNKMFDAIENWDLFISGETTTKTGTDNRTQNSTENGTENGTDNSTQNISQDTTNNTQNSLNNTSNTSNNQISDRRKSDLPQNQLQNVRDGSYVTEYNYDTNTNTAQDTSASTGTSSSAVHTGGMTTNQDTSQRTSQKTNQSTDNNIYNETVTRTPADKIEILKEFQENINSIYTMIFKDLECLFYQLV